MGNISQYGKPEPSQDEIEAHEGQAPTPFDFRGSSNATKLSASLLVQLGMDYFRTNMIPALRPAIAIPDGEADVDPYKLKRDYGVDESDMDQTIIDNTANVGQAYTNVMQLFTFGTAGSFPLPAAQFLSQLYNAALSNGMNETDAYLLVSSQIFLRMVNPMIQFVSTSIPKGQAGKTATMTIMKLLQGDANKKQHGTVMSAKYNVVFQYLNFQDQMEGYVNAIIERGAPPEFIEPDPEPKFNYRVEV